jgi:hypothetical protein
MNNKYAKVWNELTITAEKTKKKGGSLASVFKLIQDLIEFEEKIQEAINAQEVSTNKSQIEGFLTDIDKMYEVLLTIAREGISAARNERTMAQETVTEEGEEGEVVRTEPKSEPQTDTRITEESLREQLGKIKKPSISIPNAPKM